MRPKFVLMKFPIRYCGGPQFKLWFVSKGIIWVTSRKMLIIIHKYLTDDTLWHYKINNVIQHWYLLIEALLYLY